MKHLLTAALACISFSTSAHADAVQINTVEDFYLTCRPDMELNNTIESALNIGACYAIVRALAYASTLNGQLYEMEGNANTYLWMVSGCMPDGTSWPAIMQAMRNYAERYPDQWAGNLDMFLFGLAEDFPCPA